MNSTLCDVDWSRVACVASAIEENLTPSKGLKNEMAPSSQNIDKESYLSSGLLASAICHSTKGGLRGNFDGEFYKGWDFLLRAFVRRALSGLRIHEFTNISSIQLFDLLNSCTDDAIIALKDLDRRSEMLRVLSMEFIERAGDSVVGYFSGCRGQVAGKNGAYEKLARFSAFKDKQRKKSTCFLTTAHYSEHFKIVDLWNIEPMVDYHRIRLLLRLGCIRVARDYHPLLVAREPVPGKLEMSMREASRAVSAELVRLCSLNPLDNDVLLWAFARSACRHSPICISMQYENFSFSKMITNPSASRCPFQNCCDSRHDSSIRALWEPIVRTEHY
jgi:hypothetical protein